MNNYLFKAQPVHIFGCTNEKLTKTEGKRRDKIAREFGANFVGPVSIPGNSNTGWFTCRNLGEPFNSKTAREVLSACNL